MNVCECVNEAMDCNVKCFECPDLIDRCYIIIVHLQYFGVSLTNTLQTTCQHSLPSDILLLKNWKNHLLYFFLCIFVRKNFHKSAKFRDFQFQKIELTLIKLCACTWLCFSVDTSFCREMFSSSSSV